MWRAWPASHGRSSPWSCGSGPTSVRSAARGCSRPPRASATGPTRWPADSPVRAPGRSGWSSTISVIRSSPRSPAGSRSWPPNSATNCCSAPAGAMVRRERSALAALLEYRVDGLILVSPRMPAADIAAAAAEVPLVLVGRTVRGADADSVLIDENHGTALVLDHLLGLGHERIAHVDGGRAPGGPQRRASVSARHARPAPRAPRPGDRRRLHRGRRDRRGPRAARRRRAAHGGVRRQRHRGRRPARRPGARGGRRARRRVDRWL